MQWLEGSSVYDEKRTLLLTATLQDSTLKLWNLRTRKLETDLPGHADEVRLHDNYLGILRSTQVYTVDWSPDGQRVGSGGKDHILKMYGTFACKIYVDPLPRWHH